MNIAGLERQKSVQVNLGLKIFEKTVNTGGDEVETEDLMFNAHPLYRKSDDFFPHFFAPVKEKSAQEAFRMLIIPLAKSNSLAYE